MLGTIIGIDDNTVILKLSLELDKIPTLLNLHVVLEDPDKICVGEIMDIKDGLAYIQLLGEMVGEKFVFGVIRKPSFGANIKLISKEKMPLIMGIDHYEEDKHLYLGKSPIYENMKLGVSINSFFSNHFAIFGSTGSGKSYSVASIFQNLFLKEKKIPYKASIFVFDAYGEYHNAFLDIHKMAPHIHFKAYTTDVHQTDFDILKIPPWLLRTDDLALLLGVDSPAQMPIIEKALRLVGIFCRQEDEVIKHKNDIIARALIDILASGRPSAQIRDQIFSVLSTYHTKELNLETPIYQPGYVRPLKQCLLIDASGKIREMELLSTFMEKFLDDGLELPMPDGSFPYSLKDLEDAFDFALISEGSLKSDRVYDAANVLRVRLHSLVRSDYGIYFSYDTYVTEEQYIRSLLTASNGQKAQIINFNINYVDDRLAKTITKIYSRLLFDYAKDSKERKLPFHIVLEEAHRYVQNDKDVEFLGYNIFDRITKEGRKYGVLLGIISQRPSELSDTAISQCTNFLIFKMLHPRDVHYIKDMIPNITSEIISKLRILQPGVCVGFGNAFKIPVLIQMDMPDPAPTSSNCDISSMWFVSSSDDV